VAVLQAELTLANANIDSLDQKAGLLATLVIAIAGLLVGTSGSGYGPGQVALVLLGLVIGGAAVGVALKSLGPDVVRLGPNATIVAQHMQIPPALFNAAVANSLAEAVKETSIVTRTKGRYLTIATRLALATVLCLVLARLTEGL
jgi:hypothetical protein